MVGRIKMKLGMQVGLGPGHTVLDGDPAPSQFSALLYCAQTAGRIKMPLGMEIGLSPWDFVLDWAAPPQKKGGPPKGGAALSMEVGLGPDDIVLDGDPLPSSPLANIRPMSIVAKWLDGSRWHLAWRWALIQATLC